MANPFVTIGICLDVQVIGFSLLIDFITRSIIMADVLYSDRITL